MTKAWGTDCLEKDATVLDCSADLVVLDKRHEACRRSLLKAQDHWSDIATSLGNLVGPETVVDLVAVGGSYKGATSILLDSTTCKGLRQLRFDAGGAS